MDTLDTIQILINADRRALKSSLTGALSDVKDFISKINQQEVDWKMIFSRTVGPSVVSAIAGVFAMAISQALQFQAALATAGAQGSESFSNAIGSNTQGAASDFADMGSNINQTAGDVKRAMAIASKSFSDAAVQSTIVNAAGQLAAQGIGTFADNTESLTNLMKAWNIQTAPEAQSAIDGLWKAYKNGNIILPDLIKMLQESGSALSKDTSISDTAKAIESMSTVSGQTKTSVENSFKAITTAAADPTSAVAGIFKSFTGKDINELINTKGMDRAFLELAKIIDTGPTSSAVALGTQMGLTAGDVATFRLSSVSDIQKIMDEEDLAIAKTKTLAEAFNIFQKLNPFAGLWEKIENFFLKIGPDLVKTMLAQLFSTKTITDSLLNLVLPSSPMANANGLPDLTKGTVNSDVSKLNLPSQTTTIPVNGSGAAGSNNSTVNVGSITINAPSSSPTVLKNTTLGALSCSAQNSPVSNN
jgi:hypothetical protein